MTDDPDDAGEGRPDALTEARGNVREHTDSVRRWMGERSRWKADAIVVLSALVLVYALIALLAYGQGLNANGIVNTLVRLTFLMAAYGLLVLALNLHWGYAGLFNIGVAGFMSVAVFTLAFVSGGQGIGLGYPVWVGMIAGTFAAAVLGLLAALPALRLRADYFAIVTLGIAEIVRFTMKSDWLDGHRLLGRDVGLGAGSSIQVPSAQQYVFKLFTEDGTSRAEPTYVGAQIFEFASWFDVQRTTVMSAGYALVLVVAVILAYLLLSRIAFSPFGRILKAIREDEGAAQALGKPTNRVKIYSFVLGCALMGLGGMLWQASRFTVAPDAFMPIVTFYIFVALIVGGSGSNAGSIVGGIAFVGLLLQGPRMLPPLIREQWTNVPEGTNTIYEAATALGSSDPMPLLGYAIANMEYLQRLSVGVVLIVLMLYRPDGLLGYRKETAAAADLSRPEGETDD